MAQEEINTYLAPGTLYRIEGVLGPKESRSSFIRAAIDAECAKREQWAKDRLRAHAANKPG